MSPKVTPVNGIDHFHTIITQDKYTVFDFWATWCSPCETISPVFEKLSTTADDSKIQFFNVDVDDASDIAEEVGIRAMPTFVLFKNGVKVQSVVGADQAKLRSLIKLAA